MSDVRVACRVSDLVVNQPRRVEVDGIDVCIVQTTEGVFAIEDECSHAAVALSEGEVEDCTIECWLHGSRFDLRSGEPLGPPATAPVPTFPVRVEGDDVLIEISG